MKNQITTYICDICEKEYNPSAYFEKAFGFSTFKITFDNVHNGMTYTATREIVDICPECAKALINTFVSIKKS